MTTQRALYLRMAIGVLALLGLLVAIYLALYEVRLSNSLVCPNTGCEEVNQSDYVYMFGLPIGVIGVIGYSTVLGVTMAWMTRRRLAPTEPPLKRHSSAAGAGAGLPRRMGNVARHVLAAIPVSLVLVGLSGFGFLFSLFLSYLELFVIHAICTWCMISAVLMTFIFVLSMLAWLWGERLAQPIR